jgi:hypothetical protein
MTDTVRPADDVFGKRYGEVLLVHLGATGPDGWRYEARVPTSPLRVDTTTRRAQVTQDDLANSYSLQAD